jgi:hypothetical protein
VGEHYRSLSPVKYVTNKSFVEAILYSKGTPATGHQGP